MTPPHDITAATTCRDRDRARRRRLRGAAFVAATLVAVPLTACSSSSSNRGNAAKAPTGHGRSAGGATPAGGNIKACTLVTAAELSQAVGVTYDKIDSIDGGSLCNVTAPSPKDSFSFHIDKEDGAVTTWDDEAATIKQDDGSITTVSGIGDRSVQGAIKEFAAESKGYIVVVLNADVNNVPTAHDFTRTKKIAKLLVAKL